MKNMEKTSQMMKLKPKVRDLSNLTSSIKKYLNELTDTEKEIVLGDCFSVKDVSNHLNNIEYNDLNEVYKNVFFSGVFMSGDLNDYLSLITTTAILKKAFKQKKPDVTVRDIFKKIFAKEYESDSAIADMLDKNCIIMENSLSNVEPNNSYGYTSSKEIVSDISKLGNELLPF